MKSNIFLTASLRKPARSLLLLVLFGLISFVFITKAVGLILVQRETEVLGSYYRSIGILENIKDPQSGDVSTGVDLIKKSPYFSYGNPAFVVSVVMARPLIPAYTSNATVLIKTLPPKYWPNTHNTDIWFTGKLLAKDEIGSDGKQRPAEGKAIGLSLKFNIGTLLAAYPENASQGCTVVILFLCEFMRRF